MISAIVPVGDRVDEIDVLLSEYDRVFSESADSHEIIVVLDGRKPDLEEKILAATEASTHIQVIELSRKFGEAAALAAGFDIAGGSYLMTLPAYYQVEPSELSELIDLAVPGTDMAIAIRRRTDTSFDSFRRRVFHGLFRVTSGMSFSDLGCGVRLFSRDVANEIPLYGDQHRFLPALARRRGFKVREIELKQSPKDQFRGRYRLREYLHRLLDIMTVFFLVRFTKKPLRFFGTIGFGAAALGGLATLVLVIQRLGFGMPLADRPALLLATLLFVLGVQVFAIGLIGELIIFTHAASMKEYTVRRIVQSGEEPVSDLDARVAGERS